MTELITQRVQDWITNQTRQAPGRPTFAYVAHEAVHAPNEAPMYYIDVCQKTEKLFRRAFSRPTSVFLLKLHPGLL